MSSKYKIDAKYTIMIFFYCAGCNNALLYLHGGKPMKNKKRVIGLFVSAALFAAAGIVNSFTGTAPEWFSGAVNLATVILGGMGISFVAPNKGE